MKRWLLKELKWLLWGAIFTSWLDSHYRIHKHVKENYRRVAREDNERRRKAGVPPIGLGGEWWDTATNEQLRDAGWG